MATLRVGKGLEEYLARLGNLEFRCPEYIKDTVQSGADIVADSVKASIGTIPRKEGHNGRGVTDDQRKGLEDSMGIAPMENDHGYYNMKVGWDGYNSHVTKTYPHGQPNVMIARSLERGTSFMKPTPFINKAVNKVKKQAEEKMRTTLDQKIESIMK